MNVAGMIVRCISRRETSIEWIHPRARADAVLPAVQTGAVCVRAAGAKMIAAYAVASKPARVRGRRRKCVFTPGLAELFEPLAVVRAATHSVKVLRNKRMVVTGQGNPSRVLGPFIAGIRPQGETDEAVHL